MGIAGRKIIWKVGSSQFIYFRGIPPSLSGTGVTASSAPSPLLFASLI